MKKLITILLSITIFISCQENSVGINPDQTILLYPEGQLAEKGLQGTGGPLESNEITNAEGIDPENGNLWNVGDKARIDLYFPKQPNGQMVIVCPGGGYIVISTKNEGSNAAKWLIEQGITVAVVKYRLPNGHDNIPLIDIQNTFRYCHAHAEEWGIKQIGIMGFSAGGHLAATASNFFTNEVDRPDFTVLLYPVITFETEITHQGSRNYLIGTHHSQKEETALINHYSLEKHVSQTTPPTFIALTSDDPIVPVENSLRYYKALQQCDIPVEMHIFPTGGHGWGFHQIGFYENNHDTLNYTRKEFYALLKRWLESQKEICIK